METSMRQWIKAHRIELLLFLLLWTTYAYFYQSTQDNEAARFDQARAIAQDGTLSINKYWWNSADVIHYSKGGVDLIYPNKAPGMSLVAAPFFWAFSAILKNFAGMGLVEWVRWHLVTYLTTLFTVSLGSALAAVAMYRALKRATADARFSCLAVLAIWVGTLSFPFSTLFFSHQFAGSLLAIAFSLLFKLRCDSVISFRRTCGEWLGAGLLLGFSVAAEYPTALLVGLLSIYALWVVSRWTAPVKEKALVTAALILGGAVGGGTLVAYNVAAFGKPFYLSYAALASAQSAFPVHSRGWLGLNWLGVGHFLHAFAAITVYPPIGLLYLSVKGWWIYACNPVLWLALPGLAIMLWKRQLRGEGLLITAMAAAYIFFVTSFGTSIFDWSGQTFLGPRHIIPLLPFLALPLYFGARKLRFVFYPLLAISVFYMLLATAIEPRVPNPFEVPARDFLLPDYLRGKFAQNTFSLFDSQHRNLTRDSTAFNLAKIVGISGPYQLAPLMFWWLVAGGALMLALAGANSVTDKKERRSVLAFYSPGKNLIALSSFVAAIAVAPMIHHAAISSRHSEHGLLGKYYRNRDWQGEPVDVQVDPAIDFDWSKSFPLPPPFSVEWAGNIMIENPGDYTFALVADDGALLELDGETVVNVTDVLLQERSSTIYLARGLHAIRVRYFNLLFGGSIKLSWTETGRSKQVVPSEVLLPLAQTP